MATIDEIAERAARDVRADVRPVIDVDAGLNQIVGQQRTSPRRRAWPIGFAAVVTAAAAFVLFLVVRDDSSSRIVPVTTPTTDITVSVETTAVRTSTTASNTTSLAPTAVPAKCDEASLLTAVAATGGDRQLPWVGVTVDNCTAEFAQVVALADQSACPVVGQECRENQRFWFQNVDGYWVYLDSGTGIGCATGEMSPQIADACAAFGQGHVDPRLTLQQLDIPNGGCSSPTACTSLLATRQGRLATFTSNGNVLRFPDDGTNLTIAIDQQWTAFPLTFGPDDVLYFSLVDRTSGESGGVIAVATTGTRAGTIVGRSNAVLDTSGDSTVVSTAAGLVQVGCCGHGDRQPALDEPVVMAWVSAGGTELPTLATDTWIEFANDGTATVVRSDSGTQKRWTLTGAIGGRDMPLLVATDDGGILLWQYDGLGAPDVAPVLYEGRPDGTVEQYGLPGFNYPSVLSPARFAVLLNADGYVRVDLP